MVGWSPTLRLLRRGRFGRQWDAAFPQCSDDGLQQIGAATAVLEVLEVPVDALIERGLRRHRMREMPVAVDLRHGWGLPGRDCTR